MKIGFSVINNSSYGVIPHIQGQLMMGIKAAGGIPVSCLNIEDTQGLDAFVLVNSVPLGVQQQIVRNVRQYWTYLLDAPFHHANWIASGPASTTYAVIDPTHLRVLFQLDRSGVFFPHGGFTHTFQSWRDRDIDILFAGTAQDFLSSKGHIETLCPESRDLVDHMIQESLASPEVPLLELLISQLKEVGNNLTVEEAMSVLTWSDYMVRATHRHNLLQAFSEFSVKIAGKGWDKVDLSPNHRWIGEVPAEELAALMSRAKIVLCPSCGFTDGAHERILTAMGSGAVALAMPTPYLTQHFQHGKHLAYFKTIQEAVDLGRLILKGSHWEVVGEAGHGAVASGHSWVHRGKELLTLLQGQAQDPPFFEQAIIETVTSSP